jgi:hypothetical protein
MLPGYKGGTNKFWNAVKSAGNAVGSVLTPIGEALGPNIGNIASLGNAYIMAAQRDARASGGIRAPKSFVANPYEQDALQVLNGLKTSYYPIWT